MSFFYFFVIVGAIYFAVPVRVRWVLLLVASYYFYFCWKAEYLLIIFLSTTISYSAGIFIERTATPSRRKNILILVLCYHIGTLFIFKYLGFFSHQLRSLFSTFNLLDEIPTFNLLQPIGISFYTFKSISYCIDVYRGHQKAEHHLGRVALYVAFFPQLLAGPIERATRLLSQFQKKFNFDYQRVTEGLKRMLWGFFQKMVIADNLAILVDSVYNHPENHQGASLLVATLFYSFQIYCDFSGYSDIAIGAAQVMGYQTMENFNRPYFSTSVGEFWRRWHISLSSWLRDYLYIPLGGSRVPLPRWYLNLLIVFLLCGLWHGANWTFVLWGGIHGLYLILSSATQRIRNSISQTLGVKEISKPHRFFKTGMTFLMISFAWIFFRANSLRDAFYIIQHLFTGWGNLFQIGFHAIPFIESLRFELIVGVLSVLLLIAIEGLKGDRTFSEMIALKPIWVRWPVYYSLIISILLFGEFGGKQFIYFQF